MGDHLLSLHVYTYAHTMSNTLVKFKAKNQILLRFLHSSIRPYMFTIKVTTNKSNLAFLLKSDHCMADFAGKVN